MLSLARCCAFLDLPNQSTPRNQRPSTLHSGHSSSPNSFLARSLSVGNSPSPISPSLYSPDNFIDSNKAALLVPVPSPSLTFLYHLLCFTLSSRSTFLVLLELYSFGLQPRFNSYTGWPIVHHHTHRLVFSTVCLLVNLQTVAAFATRCCRPSSPGWVAILDRSAIVVPAVTCKRIYLPSRAQPRTFSVVPSRGRLRSHCWFSLPLSTGNRIDRFHS